jgi:Zn-dependent oligopeptidase
MDAFGMVLLRGNTADRAAMYRAWLGREPSIQHLLKERGLLNADS